MHGMESFKTLSIANTLFGVTERRDQRLRTYPLITDSMGKSRSWEAFCVPRDSFHYSREPVLCLHFLLRYAADYT